MEGKPVLQATVPKELPGRYSGESMQPSTPHTAVASATQFAHCAKDAGAISSGKKTEFAVEGDSVN